MLMEKFAELPAWLVHEGVNFELQLFSNGRGNDLRLCYALRGADKNSTHFETVNNHGSWQNPFYDGALQGFLYLAEGIETDQEFMEAVERCKSFLTKNKLI